ncbi:rod-binding protein [Caulobacter sp. 17J65-9]|uniref:rod-binding protein n=1 Tax=Caulobacter sp. 17J65-9 TaxID=2709382 RepID=UPI0013C6BEA2|nr:rod-binding protein [Caulobacter sp. 17J65-9]NEX95187.1 rod-binding protein [Caulobacter sp. 17J65-9]
MSSLSASSLPLDVLQGVRGATASKTAVPADVRKAAEDFEATFLSALLQPVFSSLETDGPFGGGQGEAAFKSFLVDAMAKQTVKAGGVGLADSVTRDLLKLQGLDQ